MSPELSKRIEDAVKDRNKAYKNKSEPSIVRSFQMGRTQVYMLTFVGQDEREHINYVTELRGDLRAFDRIEDIVPEINKGIGVLTELLDNSRVLFIGLLAVILVLAIVYLAVVERRVDIEKLFTLAAAVIGYLAGKSDVKGTK